MFWGVGASSLLSGARLTPGTAEGGPIGGGWWWHTPADTRDKVDLDVLVEETKLYVALSARLCESPILPHEYTKTVADIDRVLTEIEEAADGMTFVGVRDHLESLETNLERTTELLNTRAQSDPALATAAEDLQVALGNELIPALYMEHPDYEHEPAVSSALLPSLRPAETLSERTGRERRFTEISVKRAATRLSHRLARANRRVQSFLDAYEI